LKKLIRGPGIYILILLVILFTYLSVVSQGNTNQPISYDQVLQEIKAENVKALSVTENTAVGLYVKDSKVNEANFPDQYDFSVYIQNWDQFVRDVNAIVAARPQFEGRSGRLGIQVHHGAPARDLVVGQPYSVCGHAAHIRRAVVHDAPAVAGRQQGRDELRQEPRTPELGRR